MNKKFEELGKTDRLIVKWLAENSGIEKEIDGWKERVNSILRNIYYDWELKSRFTSLATPYLANLGEDLGFLKLYFPKDFNKEFYEENKDGLQSILDRGADNLLETLVENNFIIEIKQIVEFIDMLKEIDKVHEISYISFVLSEKKVSYFFSNKEDWVKDFDEVKNFLTNPALKSLIFVKNIKVLDFFKQRGWLNNLDDFKTALTNKKFAGFLSKAPDEKSLEYLVDQKKWIKTYDEFKDFYLVSSNNLFNILVSSIGTKVLKLFIDDEKWVKDKEELKKVFEKNDISELINDADEKRDLVKISKKLISTKEDFFKIFTNKDLVSFMRKNFNKVDLLVRRNFINTREDLDKFFLIYNQKSEVKKIFDLPYNNFFNFLNSGKVTKIQDIEKNDLYPDLYNTVRIVYKNPEEYVHKNPLLKVFPTYTEHKGELDLLNIQLENELKLHSNLLDKSYIEQFKALTKIFAGNKWAELPIYPDAKRLKNIEKINKKQSLETGDYELLNSQKRAMILYVRQGRGEMDSFRFCMMAKTLFDYVNSGKSKVFNDFIIAPLPNKIYPKGIHDLGIPRKKVVFASGKEFVDLGKQGNLIIFTHSDAKEFIKQGSLPLVSAGVYRNPKKLGTPEYKEEKDYTNLPLMFDFSDVYVSKYSSKEKFREELENSANLEEMMNVLFTSVQKWEKDILNRAKFGILKHSYLKYLIHKGIINFKRGASR